jgi:hypothetical protein
MIEVVGYADVLFTKAPEVQAGTGPAPAKSEKVLDQLDDKGMPVAAEG